MNINIIGLQEIAGYSNGPQLGFPDQVIAKLVVDCRHHLSPGDPERHEEPEEKVDHFVWKRNLTGN